MRHRKDGSDINSTNARAWAELHDSQAREAAARLANLRPTDRELLTALRQRRGAQPTSAQPPAAPAPVMQTDVDPEMVWLVRTLGL